MPARVSRLVAGLATVGALSFTGFLILYWHKRKRQRAIEDQLKGNRGNRKLPKAVETTGAQVQTPCSGDIGDTDAVTNGKDRKKLLKESLEENGVNETNVPANAKKAQERCINFEMLIPREAAGSLIGKGGTNIRKIQKETNTRIVATGETSENGDRPYTISGTPDAVALAENKIRKHIMSLPVITQAEMQVPEHAIGRIIGRQGENIRSIQDVSRARVDIPHTPLVEGMKLFTDDDYEAPKSVGENIRKITIRGTEEEISVARKLITEAVEQDATLRARILETTNARTIRRVPRKAAASTTSTENSNGEKTDKNVAPIDRDDPSFPSLRVDKTMEVFVSCVYHPNEFYVQMVNQETIDLDKLCATMTDYYKKNPRQSGEGSFEIGNIVAAKFSDEKFYRAKILNVFGGIAEVLYVDYGDMRKCQIAELRKIKPEFLKLRFQAILATLNLECLDDRWSDKAIDETVNLTKCATWHRMKGKVLGYLKDPSNEDRDMIWMEIYDAEDKNIADKLINKGLAGLKADEPLPPVAVAPIVSKTGAAYGFDKTKAI